MTRPQPAVETRPSLEHRGNAAPPSASSPPRPRQVALLATALLLVVAGVARGTAAEHALRVGDPFPDLAGFGLEGTLPGSLEGKVLIVDFWASWCGRCKGSFELLEQLQKRFESHGLVILSVNVDESRAAMEEFLKAHPVTFPVLRDKNKALVRAINIPAMPTCLIVGQDAKVRSIYGSFSSQEARAKCLEEVEALFRPKTRP
jgi:thiol-disulfide isomerase/thioredoxin